MPRIRQITPGVTQLKRKKRVAAYARVSEECEVLLHSLSAQVSYYSTLIQNNPEWEYAGVYVDQGITGTSTAHRDGFNRLVADCDAGKIDMVLVKSISRFARDTVDCLNTTRHLKDLGIAVYFEREKINSLSEDRELMLTLLASFAQEESRSISENTTWGKRKQFADGKGSVAFSWFLGYDKDFKINEEQAATVRLIYRLFISGLSFYAITKELESRGIKSPSGKDRWHISTVKSILTNEKYRGDALLQKQYTTDFLQKKRKTNNGEIPQYYVEEHHEAIIPPAQFDFVQAELARREQNGRYSGVSIFSNKFKCGCCGGWYGSKVWHSTDKYRKVIYRCNRKYGKDTPPCNTPHLSEEEIKKLFLKALNALVEAKEETIENLQELIETVCQIDSLGAEQERLEQELRIIAENLANLIRENASVALDQTEQAEKEEKLRTLYGEKHSRFQELEVLIQEKNDTREILTNFINKLEDSTEKQTEFWEELWGGLVDYILIDEKSSTVVFRGGIEITI